MSYTANNLRNYLDTIKRLDDSITSTTQRLEMIREKVESPPSQAMDGLPHGRPASPDRIGEAVAKAERLEQRVQKLEAERQNMLDALEEAILLAPIRKTLSQRVLCLRYVDGFQWSDVLFEVYGDRVDFLLREESYRREVFRQARNGLEDLSRWIDENAQNSATTIFYEYKA